MKYNIRKNWITSLDIMRKHPVILLPFIFGAFFEALALELIYFSARRPLSIISGPIIKKFFGEGYLHYPGNIIIAPKFFYYAQILIYIIIGVFAMSISVNIYKNIREGLPLKTAALIKNALKRYGAYISFGIIMVILLLALKRIDIFIYLKVMKLLAKYAPELVKNIYTFGLSMVIFLSNMILQIFFLLTVPMIVIKKKPLVKALLASLHSGFTNFLSLLGIIFLPFMVYLPISLLKSGTSQIIDKTFPEIVFIILGIGIIAAMFMDCFIAVCASGFLMDKHDKHGK